MISIREIDYDTDEDPDKVFSRLSWAVERVDGLVGQLISNYTVDTNRPWVGFYDREKMSFGLIEPRGFLSMKFFQIVVRGQIAKKGNKTIVSIKMRLGWNTFFIFLMVYLATVLMISGTILSKDPSNIFGLMVWLLVFSVLGTILLKRKLKNIERKIEDLFGFR